MHQTILIIDFGSQYTQLIARRVRELNVYCEIHPYNHLPELGSHIKGIILSGSPFSVRDANAPFVTTSELRNKFPLLGLCYGAQMTAHQGGGEVRPSTKREYGRAHLHIKKRDVAIFKGVSENSEVWMSHADTIISIPDNFEIIASTEDVKIAAFKVQEEKTYCLQFHPEVYHTVEGKKILSNFLFTICGCAGDWTPGSFIEETVASLKDQLKEDKVILGLSGGVDSAVAAMLLHRAIGKNLYCIFVDNGLLRKNEYQNVLDSFGNKGLQITGVNAAQRFYKELKGETDPEKKRKIIGRVFIDVFAVWMRRALRCRFRRRSPMPAGQSRRSSDALLRPRDRWMNPWRAPNASYGLNMASPTSRFELYQFNDRSFRIGELH